MARKFKLVISVDLARLKEAAEIDELTEKNICEVIKNEMGWVSGSGIVVTKIKPYVKR